MTTIVFTVLSIFVPGFIILSGIPVKSDTLKIASTGTSNRVVIDSVSVKSAICKTDTLSISGQIIQNGTSNHVEIFPAPAAIVKRQNHNNQLIHIIQTGNNNSVKINSK